MPKRKLPAGLFNPSINIRNVRQRRDDDEDQKIDLTPVLDQEDNEEEEDHKGIVREDRIPYKANGGVYTFHCKLRKTYDFEQAEMVTVSVHFTKRGQRRQLTKTNKVGYLSGNLFPRPDSEFLMMADCQSQEAADIACIFCESDGSATRVSTAKSPSLPDYGGFFHIELMELRRAHQGMDLGLRLIHETLSFIGSEWSLAVAMPALLSTHAMRWKEENDRLGFRSCKELSAEQRKLCNEASLNIQRHYARMGFEQAGRNVEQQEAWFLTKSNQRAPGHWLSKQQAKDTVDVYQAPQKQRASGLDKQVDAVLKSVCSDTRNDAKTATAIKTLTQLVNDGASVDAAHALHFAAALRCRETCVAILNALVKLGANVNGVDEYGTTPLQVAASLRHLYAIQCLVKAGADKRVKSTSNKTAFAMAKKNETDDFSKAMGLKMSAKDARNRLACMSALK